MIDRTNHDKNNLITIVDEHQDKVHFVRGYQKETFFIHIEKSKNNDHESIVGLNKDDLAGLLEAIVGEL